jgi:signal peptidase I
VVEALKFDMAGEVLASFGEVRLPVTGSSMFPCMRPGDLLEIRRPTSPVQAGDVVVFERHGKLVAHRVVECAGGILVTRGDRLRYPDAPVSEDAILGRVTVIQRRGRAIAPHRTRFERIVSAALSRTEFGTRVALYFARMVHT